MGERGCEAQIVECEGLSTCFRTFETDKAIKLFTSSGVFNEVELEARQEINYENYNLKPY